MGFNFAHFQVRVRKCDNLCLKTESSQSLKRLQTQSLLLATEECFNCPVNFHYTPTMNYVSKYTFTKHKYGKMILNDVISKTVLAGVTG